MYKNLKGWGGKKLEQRRSEHVWICVPQRVNVLIVKTRAN